MAISVEKLKRLRNHHGWSQERLSEISGISLRTIQRTETGENVSLETQLAIATAFNIPPSELLQDEDVEVGHGGINWGGVTGIFLVLFLMFIQFYLPGTPFFEPYSLLLVLGLPFAMSCMSNGLDKSISTIAMLRWVLLLPKNEVGLQNKLPYLNKYIVYCHTAGAISTLVGVIALLMTPESYSWSINPVPKNPFLFSLGVAFLTTLYAAMFAELILRPLKHQMENQLIRHSSHN